MNVQLYFYAFRKYTSMNQKYTSMNLQVYFQVSQVYLQISQVYFHEWPSILSYFPQVYFQDFSKYTEVVYSKYTYIGTNVYFENFSSILPWFPQVYRGSILEVYFHSPQSILRELLKYTSIAEVYFEYTTSNKCDQDSKLRECLCYQRWKQSVLPLFSRKLQTFIF